MILLKRDLCTWGMWLGMKLVCCAEVAPSLHDFSTVLMRRLSMPAELTVDALVGYASSWSAYSIYRKRHPDKPDPLLEYRARLTKALEVQVGVVTPLRHLTSPA